MQDCKLVKVPILVGSKFSADQCPKKKRDRVHGMCALLTWETFPRKKVGHFLFLKSQLDS